MILQKDHDVYEEIKYVGKLAEIVIKSDDELEALFGRICNDESLYNHSANVAEVATGIGIYYNFNLDELIGIYTGSIFHDVGKLKLDKAIINKNGAFTKNERMYTEAHTTAGYKLIKNTMLSAIAVDIVRSHHEKLDGTGYPASLEHREIPIYTQVVTVADMFEAMTSDRCYRDAMEEYKVYKILEGDKGVNQVAVRLLKENVEVHNQEFFVFEQAFA